MSYSVEQLHDLPVVVLRFHTDFNEHTELMDAIHDADEIILKIGKPVYYICDTTLIPPPSMKGLIEGTNAVTRRPNIKRVNALLLEIILISPNKAVQLAAVGLNSEAFGWLRIKVFATYDSVLEYLSGKFSDTLAAE